METSRKLIFYILIGLGLFASGYSAGKFSGPKDKTEQTQIDTSSNISKDTSTTTSTETKPDGTKVVTVIQDIKTNIEANTDIHDTEQIKNQASWKVALGLGYNFNEQKEVYILSINKKLLGGLSVGVFGLTDKTVGISVQAEF